MHPVPPGRKKSNKWNRVPEALERNHLIIGWAKAEGLLRPDLTPQDFRDIMQNAYSGRRKLKRPGDAAKQAWRFIHCVSESDLVVVPDGREFHIGRVASDPWFDESAVKANSAYRREAVWLKRSVPRERAGPALQAKMKKARRTFNFVRDQTVAKEISELLGQPRIPPNVKNLQQHAAPPLAQWLIHAARNRSSIAYGQAKRRLEAEIGFSTIFSAMMGIPAGQLMNQLLDARDDCPLLNVLLVAQKDRMPGDGAGGYMARYLRQPELALPGYRDQRPDRWRAAFETIAADVYAFDEWEQVYEEAFGQPLPAHVVPDGREEDGIPSSRQGEGPNHEWLRLWVKDNPGEIRRDYRNFRTRTEVVLDSADRVDVVFYGRHETVAIEVKSIDSNETDQRRGVFQCIKYRAVLKAMDIRSDARVIAILVTQSEIPRDLAALARLNGVRHFLAPQP